MLEAGVSLVQHFSPVCVCQIFFFWNWALFGVCESKSEICFAVEVRDVGRGRRPLEFY